MTTAGTRPFGLASDLRPVGPFCPSLIGSEPPPVTASEYREWCERHGLKYIPKDRRCPADP